MKGYLAIGALVSAGCGVSEIDSGSDERAPALASAEQQIIGASVTCSFPEIGRIGNCGTTLVAPDMVITAAHCVGYEGLAAPGKIYSSTENYNFDINNFPGINCGTLSSYRLKQVRSFTFVSGGSSNIPAGQTDDDVAILQLSTPVPSSIATPMRLRSTMPSLGATATAIGIGPTATNPDGSCPPPTFQKGYTYYGINESINDNTRTVGWPYTGSVCPGDSGGPVFVNGEVFWVVSALGAGNPWTSYFGEVWRLAADIDWQMAHWTCPNGAVYPSGAPVSANDRYPFARVCGTDRKNYECNHSLQSWVAKGGTCGDTSCQCSGGTALGGIQIDPAKTSCGSTVCGMDHSVYECKPGNYWQATAGSSCGY